MIKKLATIGAAAAIFAASTLPALAAVPPGPPTPAEVGCPGRSSTDLSGPQAVKPNLQKMADGECPTPPNQP